MLRALRVLTVGVDRTSGDPAAVLSEDGGGYRIMPVPLDLLGATLVADECHGSTAPVTGLVADLVRSFGRSLEHVEIAATESGPYLAELVFDAGTRVEAPAGDAIAVAMSLDVPVMVESAVLEQAAVTAGTGLDLQNGLATAGVAADEEADEVERFQRFLDTASAADFMPTAQ
jgi:bifunctional DNase/RNase